MLTLDNHLVGVTEDKPHPESYGADVPLRSEFATNGAAYKRGYGVGYDEGRDNARRAAVHRESALLAENTTLRQQLAAANEKSA